MILLAAAELSLGSVCVEFIHRRGGRTEIIFPETQIVESEKSGGIGLDPEKRTHSFIDLQRQSDVYPRHRLACLVEHLSRNAACRGETNHRKVVFARQHG